MRPDQAASIIIRPYVTENTFDRIEKENKLVFIVSNDSTKNTIKQAKNKHLVSYMRLM